MAGAPDIIFVIDTNKEKIAIQEANKMNIPVVAVTDTNSNPDGIDFPIPGMMMPLARLNFTVIWFQVRCWMVQTQMAKAGVDAGEAVEVKEELPTETAETTETEEAPKKAANA